MTSDIQNYAADHRFLLDAVVQQGGLSNPVPISLDEFYTPLLKTAKRGELLPIAGVVVRNWDPDNRRTNPGVQIGMRLYEIEGIRFVRVRFHHNHRKNGWGLDFIAVDEKDYRRFYKIALRCRRDEEPPSLPPILPDEQLDQLWKNTIGYLDGQNLDRIRAYGGRAKRRGLPAGAPGSGQTRAWRRVSDACPP